MIGKSPLRPTAVPRIDSVSVFQMRKVWMCLFFVQFRDDVLKKRTLRKVSNVSLNKREHYDLKLTYVSVRDGKYDDKVVYCVDIMDIVSFYMGL
jgi:hypothetical protein